MTNRERETFLDIFGGFDRQQWIRRQGIDVRADLNRQLSRGISVLAAKKRLSDPLELTDKRGNTTMLYYSRFNTQSRTSYYLKFRDDQLVSWNAYTREQQDRQRGLLAFENRLMRRFDITLERGMGIRAIKSQAKFARDQLNRVELALRDTITSDEYKGVGKPSASDYIVAETILLAQSRNELFAWFYNREPDKIVIHRPFETHQYFLSYKSVRGDTETVIVEFVFRGGLLEVWYVYHDR